MWLYWTSRPLNFYYSTQCNILHQSKVSKTLNKSTGRGKLAKIVLSWLKIPNWCKTTPTYKLGPNSNWVDWTRQCYLSYRVQILMCIFTLSSAVIAPWWAWWIFWSISRPLALLRNAQLHFFCDWILFIFPFCQQSNSAPLRRHGRLCDTTKSRGGMLGFAADMAHAKK